MNNLFNQGEDIAHDLQCKLEGYDAVESMSLGSMNYIKEPIKRFKKPSGEAESESLPAKIRRKQDNEGGRVVKKQ